MIQSVDKTLNRQVKEFSIPWWSNDNAPVLKLSKAICEVKGWSHGPSNFRNFLQVELVIAVMKVKEIPTRLFSHTVQWKIL